MLKICLSQAPSRDCRDRLTSGLLMNGRIGAIELYYAGGGGDGSDSNSDSVGSERFVLKAVSAEKFRGLVSDVDWTQLMGSSNSMSQQQRQGTFTLEDQVHPVFKSPGGAIKFADCTYFWFRFNASQCVIKFKSSPLLSYHLHHTRTVVKLKHSCLNQVKWGFK